MFTGLIQALGKIIFRQVSPVGMKLGISCPFSNLQIGESIAVNGVCLTVIEFNETFFTCELSPETLACSTFKFIHEGDTVNLERSLRIGDLLGGHFVYGHVDKTLVLKAKISHEDFVEFIFSGLTQDDRKYCSPKGSITVNGVSLTINTVEYDSFSIMIIPHTMQNTTFAQMEVGDEVNIEFDILAKLVINRLAGLP